MNCDWEMYSQICALFTTDTRTGCDSSSTDAGQMDDSRHDGFYTCYLSFIKPQKQQFVNYFPPFINIFAQKGHLEHFWSIMLNKL